MWIVIFGPWKQGRKGCQTACKPGSVRAAHVAMSALDGHSSGTRLAARLTRPTRATGRKCPCVTWPMVSHGHAAGRPYSVLLPVGFTLPPPLPGARCALTAPFHPCLLRTIHLWRAGTGGLFSVALSLGSPPPAVSRHRISVEPGLSSNAFRRAREAAGEPERISGRPAVWQEGDARAGASGQWIPAMRRLRPVDKVGDREQAGQGAGIGLAGDGLGPPVALKGAQHGG